MTPPSHNHHQELAALVGAFRNNLKWLAGRGYLWLPAGPSPRFGVEAFTSEHTDQVASEENPIASLMSPHADQELEASVAPTLDASVQLAALLQELGGCQQCRLAGTRKNIVFGVGSPHADLLFIGEAPGRDEDLQGIPFVGAAGQLLTKMIEAMGLTREQVYIANIIKCRPPENRDPAADEMDTCEPYLRRQIQIIGPHLIVAMGNFAAKRLLRTETSISKLRGRFHTYQGVPLMPTFHPAYLLRNPSAKRPVWDDLQAVMAEMDRMGLKRQR